MKDRKRGFSTVLLCLVFFLGLAIMLYPSVSNYWNSRTQSKAIVDYENVMASVSPEDYQRYHQEAERYNQSLRSLTYPLTDYSIVQGYDEALNVAGNGMMGILTIGKIDLELPVYHGVSDSVLNHAVGHLEGSSLPVGGESTHSVFMAHRGLPSARLFTDLDRLEVGDTFQLEVLDQVLTYEVYDIEIVLPQDVDSLNIKEGEDLCTLVTCTPYGVNTHRILVHGSRITNPDDAQLLYMSSDAYKLDAFFVAPFIAAPLLLALLIVLMVKYRKKK